MPSRNQALGHTNNRVEQQGRAMQAKIESVFERLARLYAQRAIAQVKDSQAFDAIKVRKAEDPDALERELAEILQTFAVRQFVNAGQQAAGSVGASFATPPQRLVQIIRDKEVRLQGLMQSTERMVRESIRRVVEQGLSESPKPSAGEIARRIRTQFHGPPRSGTPGKEDQERGHIFSSERAALIARTELAQVENEGIVAGYEAAGVQEIEWLAYKSPIFDRRHDKMDGIRIKPGERFVNPTTGVSLRFPGDPMAPIAETANCRCTVRAIV